MQSPVEKDELIARLSMLNGRLETIFNFSPVVVFECLVNKNWTMLYINARVEDLTGHPPQDFIGDRARSFASVIHPEDALRIEKTITSLINRNLPYEVEYRIIHKDGDVRWVWDRGVYSQAEGKLIGVMMDVTERRRREEISSLISEVRSRFIELAPDRRLFYDYLLARLLEVTESGYGFIGDVLEEKGRPYLKSYAISDISWSEETAKFYRDTIPLGIDFKNLDTLFGEVLKTKTPLITNDAPAHPKRGGLPPGHPPLKAFMGVPIFCHEKLVAMVGLANRAKGYSAGLYDEFGPLFDVIGDMVQAVRLEQDLEAQRVITVHQAKLASIGELAAGVGHEINNPLAIILGQLTVLKLELGDELKLTPGRAQVFEKIETAIERIGNIVDGLRAFARQDRAGSAPFDLAVVVDSTWLLLRDIYQRASMHVELSVERDLWVLGSAGRMQQVLVNLLNNARDALEGCDERRISLRAYRALESVVLEVADSGPGVATEIREKIFDPFFTTKESSKGTGIGLAITKRIVKEHQGELTLDQGPLGGALFRVTLPLHAKAAQDRLPVESSATVAPPVATTKGAGTVLLVDDEEALREVLATMLTRAGHRVIEASDGINALEVLKENPQGVDVVVTDMQMPKLTGPQLLQRVRQELGLAVPFVYITGGIDVSLESMAQDVSGAIAKPFTREQILATLHKALEKKT